MIIAKIRNLFLFFIVILFSACSNKNHTLELPIQTKDTENQSEYESTRDNEELGQEEDNDVNEEISEGTESFNEQLNSSMEYHQEEPIIDENIDPDVVEVILTHIEAVNERDKKTVQDTLDTRYENEWQMILWDYAIENDMKFQVNSMRYYGSNWESQIIISISFQDEMNGSIALWKTDDGWKIDNFDVSLRNNKKWLLN